jgi:hypothetical protein
VPTHQSILAAGVLSLHRFHNCSLFIASQVLQEYLKRAKEEFKVEVICVTTDSASNMVHMKELAEEDHPHMIWVPCMAHWMNLAAKDISAESAMLERVIAILKWFDRNHAAHAGVLKV